jgi:hypothetical protein
MKIFPLRVFAWAGAATLFCSTFSLHAAVIAISDADYTGSIVAGTPDSITGDALLFSLTTTEGMFTNLLGATANSVVTANLLSSIGTSPADANAAVTGLAVNDAVNNLQSGNFQLGGSFDLNTRFFIVETTPVSSTPGDPVTITLIDSLNNAIGTFTLLLTAANFTSSPANTTNTALATVTYTAGQGNLVQKLGGVTFALADFAGTGDLSLATGIRLVSPGAVGGANILDPSVVGTYAVPEPATGFALLGGLSVVFAVRRFGNARAI